MKIAKDKGISLANGTNSNTMEEEFNGGN